MPRFWATASDSGGEATRQCSEDHLGRRDPVVLGREQLGMVGVQREGLLVRLLLAETEEALDRRTAVCAVDPLTRCPELELRRLRSAAECFTRFEKRADIDTVVNG